MAFMKADKRSVSPFSLFLRSSSSSFPFLASSSSLLSLYLQIYSQYYPSCQAASSLSKFKPQISKSHFKFQIPLPLILSFSLSKIPIWIFLHGSCCSGIFHFSNSVFKGRHSSCQFSVS
ncbi:hypothetical protein Hanom_Chr15g01343591 [Helianthus anomalus]